MFLAYFETYFDKIMYAIGHIFVDVNGQKLKNNLVIWSPWWGERDIGREETNDTPVLWSEVLSDWPTPIHHLCPNSVQIMFLLIDFFEDNRSNDDDDQ